MKRADGINGELDCEIIGRIGGSLVYFCEFWDSIKLWYFFGICEW